MKKLYFDEPKMDVVHFNTHEMVIAMSCVEGLCDDDTPLGPNPCTEMIEGNQNW